MLPLESFISYLYSHPGYSTGGGRGDPGLATDRPLWCLVHPVCWST